MRVEQRWEDHFLSKSSGLSRGQGATLESQVEASASDHVLMSLSSACPGPFSLVLGNQHLLSFFPHYFPSGPVPASLWDHARGLWRRQPNTYFQLVTVWMLMSFSMLPLWQLDIGTRYSGISYCLLSSLLLATALTPWYSWH